MVNAQTDLPFYLGGTDVVPLGTLQSLMQLPPLMLAFNPLVQPQLLKLLLSAKKKNTLKFVAPTISSQSLLRPLVL